MHRFTQLDVFAEASFVGNPLAVVHDADDLSDGQMAAVARWTNLSETTFLLTPRDAGADYRVRIWTPDGELPFAGHPTLGSAQAWLLAGGEPRTPGRVVQECGVGLVTVRLTGDRLAFAAPPLRRSGPLDPDTLRSAALALGLASTDVLASAWCDNGPGWVGLLVKDADTVLAIRPDYAAMGDLKPGVIGPCRPEDPVDFEVRAFYPPMGEDPVTGSLNAALALWLIDAGLAPENYTVRQGTSLQRDGRLSVHRDAEATWVEGAAAARVTGTIDVG